MIGERLCFKAVDSIDKTSDSFKLNERLIWIIDVVVRDTIYKRSINWSGNSSAKSILFDMYCLKPVIYPFTVPKFISLILQNSAKRYHHRSRAIIHGLLKNTCTTRANNKRSMYFYSSVRRYIYLRNEIQNLIKGGANQFEGFIFPSTMVTINCRHWYFISYF